MAGCGCSDIWLRARPSVKKKISLNDLKFYILRNSFFNYLIFNGFIMRNAYAAQVQ
jgi:hypothetical protein